MVRNLWLVSGQVLGLTACLSLFWACGGDNSGGRDGDDDGGSNSVGGSGGSGGGGAGAATGGSGGSSGGASTCTTAKGNAADTLVYDGATSAGTCPSGIAAPRNGYFFGYGDSTPDTTRAQLHALNGRGGADDCAYHASGSGFADYGAGAGFDLNYVNNSSCPYDASAFMGISVYLKGTTTGTRGDQYALTPNSVRLKLVTTDESGGDDFGTWCTINETDWTECRVTFAEAAREGWNADYTATALDPTKLVKVQFEFPTHDDNGVKAAVSYDVYIDDVTFF